MGIFHRRRRIKKEWKRRKFDFWSSCNLSRGIWIIFEISILWLRSICVFLVANSSCICITYFVDILYFLFFKWLYSFTILIDISQPPLQIIFKKLESLKNIDKLQINWYICKHRLCELNSWKKSINCDSKRQNYKQIFKGRYKYS